MLLIVRSRNKSRPPEEKEKGEEGVATTTVTNINNILRKRKSNTKSAKTREVEVVKEVNQDPLRNRPMMNMVLKRCKLNWTSRNSNLQLPLSRPK